MVDRVSEQIRSYIMSTVGSKHTGPEMTVRKMLHRLGYRYRLHKSDLPGSPDVVFQKRKKTIFVHGCFWHGHNCKYGNLPKSRKAYWQAKIDANKARDLKTLKLLYELDWQVLVIWQCQLKDLKWIQQKLVEFLGPTRTA